MNRQEKISGKTIFFFVSCAVILVLLIFNARYSQPIDESFIDDYSEFNEYTLVNNDPTVYQVSQDGTDVGYLVFTSHYGYQSDVTMATLVGEDGTVIDARAYSQNETPSYFRKLVGASFFKNNFNGKSIADGFSLDTNVDGISHATFTSKAVTKAVQEGVSYVGKHYLNMSVASPDSGMKVGYADICVIIMLILALVTSRFTKKSWLKWVTRVFSIIVMGFIITQFITLSVLVAFFSLNWPSVTDYLRWYLLIFGVLILLLGTGKNVYCQYMCPFGAFQEVEFSFGGPLGKKPINPRVTKIMRLFPGLLLLLSLLLALGTHDLGFVNYEPFSLLFGQVGVGIQWALLPLAIAGALFSRRIYCSFACPVGYVLNKIVLVRSRLVRFFKGSDHDVTKLFGLKKMVQTTDEITKADDKTKSKLTGHDWLVMLFDIAIIVVSLASILQGLVPA